MNTKRPSNALPEQYYISAMAATLYGPLARKYEYQNGPAIHVHTGVLTATIMRLRLPCSLPFGT